MSENDGKTKYDGPPPSDEPTAEETYSLEEILAEFGSGLERRLLREAEQAAQASAEQPVPEEVTAEERPAAQAPPAAAEALPPDPAPPAPKTPPEAAPPPPRSISLEEVVGITVDAVLEESAEPLLKPRRGLFSRRKLEETEQLFDPPAPAGPPEAEPIGPEPELYEAEDEARRQYRARKATLPVTLILALAVSAPPAAERYGVAIPFWTGDLRFQSIALLACLAIALLLCRQVVVKAFSMLARRRCVSELLITLSALSAMADCAACLLLPTRSAMPPYGAIACLALFFAQWGVSRESRGLYDTFRAAGMDDAPPYLVTDTERGARKLKGAVSGFYTTAMRSDAATLWQAALLPVVLVGSLVFAGLTSLGRGRGADFTLNWSAILAAGATFSLPLCWGLPFSRLARHLHKVGCAVAGWSGAERISRRRCMILTDTDLFPPGTISLNGIKVYGEERKKVASYAATLARAAGSGLERLFDSFLRSEDAKYETAAGFSFFEEGGWSATIHGESALMGTASFMRKMDVRLPGDVNLKTGIFLAVDRQLIAVFAVKYNPAENVDFALRMMRRSRVTAILAARDPNITPELLKRKFHKGVRVEYPGLTSRIALSEAERDRDLPRALLFREGLLPYAETVVGSRRMCRAVRRAAAISLTGSILGTLLAFYLVFQGAYDLITPMALELFLLLWTLPVLLIADWGGRY